MKVMEKFHAQIMDALAGKTDSERSKMQLLHDEWRVGRECVIGEVYRYRGDLYRCNQTHTTQEGWEPDTTAALFSRIMYKEGIRIIPDVLTASTAFAEGEQGWWNDKLYVSAIDANVWTPEQYPGGWEVVE